MASAMNKILSGNGKYIQVVTGKANGWMRGIVCW